MGSALQHIEATPDDRLLAGPRGVAPASPDATGAAREAEQRMVRLMIVATLVAIPVFIGVWMGLVAIAITFTDEGDLVPLAMSAAVGVLSGVFWGTWMGFVTYSHGQEAERKAERSAARVSRAH